MHRPTDPSLSESSNASPCRQRPGTAAVWVLAFALSLAAMGGGRTARAQDTGREASTHAPAAVSMTFRDVRLARALERIASATRSSLVYDSDLVRGHRVFCSATDASATDLLRCVLRDVPIDFIITSTGTYILVESARQEPAAATVAGRVVDASTGEPLANANVLLADASTGAATSAGGLFHFSSLVPGTHRIVVTHVGYETQVDTVTVAPGERERRRIALKMKTIPAEPVVVDGIRRRLPSGGLGEAALSGADLQATGTGGTPDIARSMGRRVGLTTGGPLADLYIQGSGSGEHQVELDGVPVRNPVSVGRLLSAFSPLALGRLTTHKAGFGVMEGSHLSGVVDIEHDLRRRQPAYATVQADPISLNARLQTPPSASVGGEDVTAMAAGRVGMWGVYRDPTLQGLIERWSTLDPILAAAWRDEGGLAPGATLPESRARPTTRLYDLHGAVRFDLSAYRSLTVSAYRGYSALGADLTLASAATPDQGLQGSPEPPEDSGTPVPTYDRLAWSNTAAQVRYDQLVGARTALSIQGFLSRYASESRYETGLLQVPEGGDPSREAALDAVPRETNRVTEAGVEARADVSLSASTRLSLAADARYLTSRFRIGNAFVPSLDHEVWGARGSFAARATTTLGLHTTVEAGTRLTYVPGRRTVYAEPRAALRYDRSVSGLGDLAVRLAGGLYRQYTNEFDLSRDGATAVVPTTHMWLPVDASLAPQRAMHLAGEALWMPSDPWSLRLEGYVKWQPRLLAIDYPALQEVETTGLASEEPLDQADFIAESDGRAAGLGAQLRYEADALDLRASYTYSIARRTVPQRFGDERTPAPWNEPHRATLSATLPIAGGLSARVRADGIWGRPWGYRKAYYDYLAPARCTEGSACAPTRFATASLSSSVLDEVPAETFADPGDDVLPPLVRVDAGLSYGRTWGSVHLQARVDLLNLLDRDNVVEWRYRSRPDGRFERFARTLPGRYPVVSLRIGY